jgi:hypothetical protein
MGNIRENINCYASPMQREVLIQSVLGKKRGIDKPHLTILPRKDERMYVL